ncbi:hypothetical protein RYZ26_17185 [Terasakiella sp. A23]|uniref:hypothetical protein n=1 Tax=Terasakiella sp. FCG-A23 TaxID=3080561 RepID=UPI00295599ED|nr:hypothetical protein [Terasakiella sp. A23]MDV7341346.1 hypothetical protein [Terasakiella sp. A23]
MIQKNEKRSLKRLKTYTIFAIAMFAALNPVYAASFDYEKPMPIKAKIVQIGAGNEIRIHALTWLNDVKVTDIYIRELDNKLCVRSALKHAISDNKLGDIILLTDLEPNLKKGGFYATVFRYKDHIDFKEIYDDFMKNNSKECKLKLPKN